MREWAAELRVPRCMQYVRVWTRVSDREEIKGGKLYSFAMEERKGGIIRPYTHSVVHKD